MGFATFIYSVFLKVSMVSFWRTIFLAFLGGVAGGVLTTYFGEVLLRLILGPSPDGYLFAIISVPLGALFGAVAGYTIGAGTLRRWFLGSSLGALFALTLAPVVSASLNGVVTFPLVVLAGGGLGLLLEAFVRHVEVSRYAVGGLIGFVTAGSIALIGSLLFTSSQIHRLTLSSIAIQVALLGASFGSVGGILFAAGHRVGTRGLVLGAAIGMIIGMFAGAPIGAWATGPLVGLVLGAAIGRHLDMTLSTKHR